MLSLCKKLLLVIFGLGCFASISTPIPFLLSNLENSNVWMASGLICSCLVLVFILYMFYTNSALNLRIYKDSRLITFSLAPIHCGITGGAGAAIYQDLLLSNRDWVHQYATIALFIMAVVFNILLICIVLFSLNPINWNMENMLPFNAKMAMVILGLYFVAFPTTCLVHTVIKFTDSWFWLYVNYGLIICFVVLFSLNLKRSWLVSRGLAQYKSLDHFFAFYFIVYAQFILRFDGLENFELFQSNLRTIHDKFKNSGLFSS